MCIQSECAFRFAGVHWGAFRAGGQGMHRGAFRSGGRGVHRAYRVGGGRRSPGYLQRICGDCAQINPNPLNSPFDFPASVRGVAACLTCWPRSRSAANTSLLPHFPHFQGRGRVLDVLAEIQERNKAVKDLEQSLLELHQIFLDMAVLVEAQVGRMAEWRHRWGDKGERSPMEG